MRNDAMNLSQAAMSIDERVRQTMDARSSLAADISAEIASMETRLETLRRMRHALLTECEEEPRPVQQHVAEARTRGSWAGQ
jgi:hypothetical protein